MIGSLILKVNIMYCWYNIIDLILSILIPVKSKINYLAYPYTLKILHAVSICVIVLYTQLI